MQKRRKKTKILWGRLLDCILLVVFPILSIYLLLLIHKFTNKYMLIGAVVLLLIYLGYLKTFKLKGNKRSKRNKQIELLRKLILVPLCIAMFFASSIIKGIHDGITNLESDQHETKVHIDVLVLKNRDVQITNLKQLRSATLGFQLGDEGRSVSKVESELQEIIGNEYGRYEYSDYETIFHDYYNGYVDAIIINQAQKERLLEPYHTLYEDSTVLKSYTYTYKTNIEGNNIDVTKEKFTVYISASDQSNTPASNSLSDMNMLMIIDPTIHHITTISIPRDSYVPNPAYDNISDKLTHTGNDGVTNTVKAVEQTLQIDIDFYVKISFASLIEIVDTLGGIDVNVLISFTEQDENRSFEPEDLITLQAGMQKLNGKQALAYSRHRDSYIDQDLGRNQAQIEVMKGIIKRLLTVDGIGKIDDVLKLLPNYVIMNFSNSQISSFVKQQVDEMKGWSITSLQLNNGIPDSATTASTGNLELSIYYLSKQDLIKVNGVYHMIQQDKDLSEINFDLNQLYKDFSNFKEDGSVLLAP